jgi:small redox-active disulfide protein 2
MNIKVLGPGCANCHRLKNAVDEAIRELGIDATVESVTDMMEILNYPIIASPGLVINEKVQCFGRVPGKDEIIRYIMAASAAEKE